MKEVMHPAFTHGQDNRIGCLGETLIDKRHIRVNRKLHEGDYLEFLDTAIHEEVHAVYPEFGERETYALTKELYPTLTPEQKVKYFNLYDRKRT